ncbi:MAG: response regulator, partial [Candidatus Latescibacterota bacterium]
MRILTAEDDPSSRLVLETTLARWGYEVVSRKDGLGALEVLQGPDPPQLAVLDWM